MEIPSSTVMDPGFSQLAVLWEREKTQSIAFGSSVVAPKCCTGHHWELLTISPTWMFVLVVPCSRALPPRCPPQCSCVVIESSFDPGERLQAPGSLWFFFKLIVNMVCSRRCIVVTNDGALYNVDETSPTCIPGVTGSMIPCILVLFQPICATIVFI